MYIHMRLYIFFGVYVLTNVYSMGVNISWEYTYISISSANISKGVDISISVYISWKCKLSIECIS